MSACCCSLAGTAACQTCPQNPYAVMSKMMTPQPTALRDIMVNPQIEKPQTNADRIRAMSDEELARHYAKRIAQCYGCEAVTEDDCFECQMEWLKAPVEVAK